MGYKHTESEAGISWYTHMWSLFPGGVPENWGIGMPGTWLVSHSSRPTPPPRAPCCSAWLTSVRCEQHGKKCAEGSDSSGGGGVDGQQQPCISFRDACACNPNGWPNSPAVSKDGANGCCNADGSGNISRGSCSFLYETIEGGPQDDERWRTMANVGCFSYTAGTGLFLTGGNNHPITSPDNQHPCDEIAFVSLSNQMVMQPNGAAFSKHGMLGVGYVRTPLGKVSAEDNRNFWTLIFDTENFSGPLGYYLPEWFAGRDRSAATSDRGPNPRGSPDPAWYRKSKALLDMGSPGITMNNDQVAMEWNHGVTYQQVRQGH
jgi:hypothetical protein